MKTNYPVLFIAAFLLSACSVGVNKDLLSGLKISNSGLSYKENYLSREHIKLNTSEYSMGDTIYLFIDGIEGYAEKDGKLNRGASMVITDSNAKKLIDEADVYAESEAGGITKEEAANSTLMLILGAPMASGNKYLWKSKIWDKNGKGEINAEVEFTIK